MSTFIKVLNSTNSTSNTLSGHLKELTKKAKNLLVIPKSGRGRLRERSLMRASIRGVWVKVKSGFHSQKCRT